MAFLYQLRQPYGIDCLCYGVIDPLPYKLGYARICAVAVTSLNCRAFHRVKTSLKAPQDVADRDLGCPLCQPVPAARSADAQDEPAFFQHTNQLFQITFGYVLSLSDALCGDRALILVGRKIDQRTQSVTPSRR